MALQAPVICLVDQAMQFTGVSGGAPVVALAFADVALQVVQRPDLAWFDIGDKDQVLNLAHCQADMES